MPELSLVLLIGASGSGKSTFAKRHFKPTEIVSSDFCRGLVSDDENSQAASGDAFELLHFIVDKRLKTGLLTVVDATNVQKEDRKSLLDLARANHCLTAAIVLDMPDALCHERNSHRNDRNFGSHVVRRQRTFLRKSLSSLKDEGFRQVYVLKSPEEVENIEIKRSKLWNNRKEECGPFDIIGDIHGCYDELTSLLAKLGYEPISAAEAGIEPRQSEVDAPVYRHSQGRRVIFLGDLVDRGPASDKVLALVMNTVDAGHGFCVPGNHDIKLLKKLRGKKVRITHGLAETLEQLEPLSQDYKDSAAVFIEKLVSHLVLDGGNLVVAHAGLKEAYQGRSSGKVREFCLYGETTGETDEYGLPVRYNWAIDYRGKARVVYGHTPTSQAAWLNNTICIDTGCVFGGSLTALRYPENELVSVPALRQYYEPAKPLHGAKTDTAGDLSEQDGLSIEDVLIPGSNSKKIVETGLMGNLLIKEENARAALEVMSRFALHPRYLVYLPPTMSPGETSKEANLLEHPREALAYYGAAQIEQVVLQEKHMGSRALVLVGRDAESFTSRFGGEEKLGVIYTRSGRSFFNADQVELETALLKRISAALAEAELFEKFKSDWFLIDCELLPWSAKAQGLLQEQYAAVAASSEVVLGLKRQLTQTALRRLPDSKELQALAERSELEFDAAEKFRTAYGHYCWPVEGLEDLKVAPFQILACEKTSMLFVDHLEQMKLLAPLAEIDSGIFRKTRYRLCPTPFNSDGGEEGLRLAMQFFEEITGKIAKGEVSGEGSGKGSGKGSGGEAGAGEGIVVKPYLPDWQSARSVMMRDGRLLQPAIKCRASEYLRIIYGADYLLPHNLEKLKQRGLSLKRSLAAREFALGAEALDRLSRGEPLHRIHECVFAVLALESAPVDPRL